jgi:lysozyme family protein
MYWDKLCCDNLPQGVDYAVFDFGVNAGTSRSAKFLQRAVGAVPDGAVGPGTLGKVKAIDAVTLLKAFSDQKETFYNTIVQNDPTQSKFLKGWLNRVASVQTTAESMVV